MEGVPKPCTQTKSQPVHPLRWIPEQHAQMWAAHSLGLQDTNAHPYKIFSFSSWICISCNINHAPSFTTLLLQLSSHLLIFLKIEPSGVLLNTFFFLPLQVMVPNRNIMTSIMKSRLQTLPRYVTTHLTYKLFEVLFQVSDPNALPHFMPLARGPQAQSFS